MPAMLSASANCSAELLRPCSAGGDSDNVSTDRLGLTNPMPMPVMLQLSSATRTIAVSAQGGDRAASNVSTPPSSSTPQAIRLMPVCSIKVRVQRGRANPCHQDPQDQPSEPIMRTAPAHTGLRPYSCDNSSGMNASVPKKAALAMPRSATTLGKPRRARNEPRGNSCRSDITSPHKDIRQRASPLGPANCEPSCNRPPQSAAPSAQL